MKACSMCGEDKPIEEFHVVRANKDGHSSRCKPCACKVSREWRKKNPERVKEVEKAYYHRNKGKKNEQSRAYYRANAEKLKAAERDKYHTLRHEAYMRYGGYQCACCGESEPAFLCLDHVNNDGYWHRKQVHPRSLPKWLKDQGYPKGMFQVLCYNCNQGKRINGGTCPHQSSSDIDILETTA